MRVTIDPKRVVHLVLLLVLTVTFGRLLIERYEWNRLSAYGLVCSVVCQISNVIMKLSGVSDATTVANNNTVEADVANGSTSSRAKKSNTKKSRKSR